MVDNAKVVPDDNKAKWQTSIQQKKEQIQKLKDQIAAAKQKMQAGQPYQE